MDDVQRDPQFEFHRRLSEEDLAALWVARRGVDLSRPRSDAKPKVWAYDSVRPRIMEAGSLVTAEDAFRRVIVLENPAYGGEMRVTNTLYAGLQLVLPGEIAPCHRHTQTAIRFVIEGEGAYTSVDGERTALHPGDFVVTPAWSWHDHGNQGDGPVIWLDCLDTPLVGFLDTAFRETYPDLTYPVLRPQDDAQARYGANMLPVGFISTRQDSARMASPVMNYSYKASRAALAQLAKTSPVDPCDGLRMRYSDPATGGWPTPTMGAFLQYLPRGFSGAEARMTDSTVYVAVEGRGCTIVDGTALSWGPRDVFVVPGWLPYRHEASDDAVLFSLSDRPVQQALGLWREDKGR
jgi:gentisate 1,2-dioxygenase